MRRLLIVIFFMILVFAGYSQRVYRAVRFYTEVKVDGYEDEVWGFAPIAGNFVQYKPDNGKPATKQTFVRVGYTNKNLYLFAILFDDPKQISDYLTSRDEIGQADWFGVFIDTYNNGQVAYAFIVTAAGVQVDKKIVGTSEDKNWDAVWKSKVRKTTYGWIVEMKIPFSTLRFYKSDSIVWGINFMRNIQRNRELDSWSYLDIKQSDLISQYGKLVGLKDIKQGFRVDLFPYASYNLEFNGYVSKYYNGGLDLKLGLSKSFTLDMMLIPDFGEVQSDDPILNLSPYETYYSEKRQFFTEGTEIFRVANVFYSRRIGGRPSKYYLVPNMLEENEVIVENPLNVSILNATKISGKTRRNLGLGILNAITDNTYATVLDTLTGETRQILTEPQANYNVLAITKDLPNSSFIGVINTNKFVPSTGYMSDVIGFETSLKERTRTYGFRTRIAMSNIWYSIDSAYSWGYYYFVNLGKIRGNFKFGFSRTLISDTYNPNDLGYLAKNDYIVNSAYIAYFIYRPVLFIRNWTTRLSVDYQTKYEQRKYIGTQFKFESYGTLKNLTSVGMRLYFTPDRVYNYYEPRVENYTFIEYPKQNYSFWISTDYSKPVAIDFQFGFYFPIEYKVNQEGGWLLLSPRLHLTDRMLIVYSFKGQVDRNNYGYVGISVTGDTVFFGKRNIRTIENVFNFEFAFGTKSFLSLRARHYWSIVNYFDYYALFPDGSLATIPFAYRYLENQDKNFNSFNIDVVYKWQFLPGSEISIIYKKQITSLISEIETNYFRNLRQFMQTEPDYSILTFKIVIYI